MPGRFSKVVNLSAKTRLGLLIQHRFAESFIRHLWTIWTDTSSQRFRLFNILHLGSNPNYVVWILFIFNRNKYLLPCGNMWSPWELVVLPEMLWNPVPLSPPSEAFHYNKIAAFLHLSMNPWNSIRTGHVETPVVQLKKKFLGGKDIVKATQFHSSFQDCKSKHQYS